MVKLQMSRVEHFKKHQLAYEITFIVICFFIGSTINATSEIMEAQRNGAPLPFSLWEPFVWEYSSAISTMLLLPAISYLLAKFSINWQALARTFGVYLLASLAFSLSHIGIMVGLREVIYWTQSGHYDFGVSLFEFGYEYRKDLWSFILLVMMFKCYQYISSQLLGEASTIADSDETSVPTVIERLLVKKLGKEFIIRVGDIEWLESSGNYVNLHIKGRIYPMRTTLTALMTKISAQGFCRIHRSYAINLNEVLHITSLSSGDSEVQLNNGKLLNLSRRYKEDFKLRLG